MKNMKKHIFAFCIYAFLAVTVIIYAQTLWFQNNTTAEIIKKEFSPLPVQSGICDIIGIGRVTNTWLNGEGVFIAVDNYWFGDPGCDALSIPVKTNQIPIMNEPLVFFISSYYGYDSVNPGRSNMYNFILDENKRDTLRPRPERSVFFYDDRSWFYTSETNLVSFASNLVVAAKSSNTNMFYEVIRDGYRLNPVDSRICEDSLFAFQNCYWIFTTNFLQQIWSDPLLIDHIRDDVKFNYELWTGVEIE